MGKRSSIIITENEVTTVIVVLKWWDWQQCSNDIAAPVIEVAAICCIDVKPIINVLQFFLRKN